MSCQPPGQPTVRHIAQGQFAVGGDPALVITTVLGSCVAVCLLDPTARLGGMNHILLPDRTGRGRVIDGFGASAMEQLINALLKAGASRDRLCAKVFGGAKMVANLTDIGALNARFAIDYLACERIPVAATSLGGDRARMVRYWPASGLVRQKLLEWPHDVVPARVPANGVELFR